MVNATTSDGAWTFHSTTKCEHKGCRMGDVLINNESQQMFDATCWTWQDWEEFCEDDFDRICVAEQMEEVGV